MTLTKIILILAGLGVFMMGCGDDSTAVCGNGIVEPGEECDNENLNGFDCTDFGYDDPAGLTCTASCVFDTSGCSDDSTAVCGNGIVEPGEECDDGVNNSDTEPNACRTDCLLPSCGDGVVDSGEECDDGIDNGAPMLGGCSEICKLTSRYERVLRVNEAGTVEEGDFSEAYARVAGGLEDCLLRFDDRVARPEYIEYELNQLRFDFHPLYGWHNSYDAYAFVMIHIDERAGLGSSYRRGSWDQVWRKSDLQHGEHTFTSMPVDLYCERTTNYKHIGRFLSTGVPADDSPGDWDDLFDAVVENAAHCKVRFEMNDEHEGRIHPVSHIEYAADRINFDFLGLHAQHNSWEAYAFATIHDGVRAGIAASYRRGCLGGGGCVESRDRTQHSEGFYQPMTIDVFCADVFEDVFEINPDGTMAVGVWAELYEAVAGEMRDCRIVYDNRISGPEYIEYHADYLQFDFKNLYAWHNGWDSYAMVEIQHGQGAGLRSSHRRGHADTVWRKSSEQHAFHPRTDMPIRIHCEPDRSWHHAFSINASGETIAGDRDDFIDGMTSIETARECRIRIQDRLTHPVYLDHSTLAIGLPVLYFDYVNLAAFHDSWDAYATTVLGAQGLPFLSSSYRRGHGSAVWQRDRDQHPLAGGENYFDMEFYCR